MVKLEGKLVKNDVVISKDSFEHLLNCLDNQKYLHEVNADAIGSMGIEKIRSHQDTTQAAIDDFNRQCRQLLNSNEE